MRMRAWSGRCASVPGAFGPAEPARDLLLSPDHAVFRGGALIPARALINGSTIVQEPASSAHYFHVELPRHAVLLAEGLPCESYLDTGNRAAFAGCANGRGRVAWPRFARHHRGMIDKIVQSMAEAMAGIRDGSVVLLGGFGAVGQPDALIDGLIEQGAKDLTVVANNAGTGRIGPGAADGAWPRAADHLQLPAQRRLGGVRGAVSRRARSSWRSCRRARSPSACAPPAPGSPPSSRHRRGHAARRGQGAARDRRPHVRAGTRAAGRCRAGRGLAGGPLGQPDLPASRPQLQPGHGDGGGAAPSCRRSTSSNWARSIPRPIVTPGIFVDRVLHVPYGDPPVLRRSACMTPPLASTASPAADGRRAPRATFPKAGTSTSASASRP